MILNVFYSALYLVLISCLKVLTAPKKHDPAGADFRTSFVDHL